MSGRDYFDLGNFNVACSMCGRKRKASEMVKNWQGQWRCPAHNETRHPQDFVKGEKDYQAPPYTQPETDIDILVCTIQTITAIPGYAGPGCMVPGRFLVENPAPVPPGGFTPPAWI